MRMILYPFGYDSEPIVRHANLLEENYEIVALVSPSGWDRVGRNIESGHDGKLITIYETFEEVMETYDSLLIPPFETIEVVENRIVNMIINQIPHLSSICCVANLTETNLLKLKQACDSSRQCFFANLIEDEKYDNYTINITKEKYPSLKFLSVPIVVIAGVWEKTDKFELSLSLRERFIDNGYRVAQIASRDGCKIFGFHSFPSFMFEKKMML